MDVEKIVRQYIAKSLHLSLATSVKGKPWVCEVHFAYDQDLNLYFRSLPTRRHSLEIKQNPQVAGNIISQHQLEDSPKGIYFEGTAVKLEAGEDQDLAAKCITQRLMAGDDVLLQAEDPNGHQFYKIIVAKYYAFGEFEGQRMSKYELDWGK